MQSSVKEDRHLFVGGSDIAVIMGLSPFKTRWELLQEKAQIKENDFEGNEYTEYGNILEPKIRFHINLCMKKNFIEDKLIETTWRYHSDGHDLDSNELLEIKTTSQVHESLIDYKGYLVQLLFGMNMHQAEKGYLAVYERPTDFDETFEASRLQIFEVNARDYDYLTNQIVDAVAAFEKDLEKLRLNPSLTESDLMPTEITQIANGIEMMEESMTQYLKLKDMYDDAKEMLRQEMIKHSIKSWETPNGTKFTLVLDGEDTEVDSFDEKTFKKENEDLYKKYLVKKIKKGRKGFVRITLRKEEE